MAEEPAKKFSFLPEAMWLWRLPQAEPEWLASREALRDRCAESCAAAHPPLPGFPVTLGAVTTRSHTETTEQDSTTQPWGLPASGPQIRRRALAFAKQITQPNIATFLRPVDTRRTSTSALLCIFFCR